LPMPARMRVQEMKLIDTVVDQCLRESGARGISSHSRNVALLAILLAPPDRTYRKRIKETFKQAYPQAGSIFLVLILPILISVISAWISRWIINRTTDLKMTQAQAFDALIESSPSMRATLTSIRTPPTKASEQGGW
jgi:hypothetical protein